MWVMGTIKPTVSRIRKISPLKPAERVELLDKKAKDDSGEPTFEVQKMNKDLGQCTATSAENR